MISKKSRRRRNRSARHINIHIYVVALFLGGLMLFAIHFFLNSSKVIAYDYQLTKKITRFPTGFPLYINLSTAERPSPTLAPKPKAPAFIPIAQAERNTVNDYCLNVPVLFYHHIQPLSIAQQLGHAQLTVDSDYFDKQMAYLSGSSYRSLSADELVDALINHRALPAKSIVVTFDDGYDDNYNYAFQILKKYNIAGNFMIPTGLIENKGYMTWSQLKEMAGNPLMHIYNHTWSHASLGGAAKEKIEYEITTANKQLEENLGKRVSIFTYPYGSYSQLVIDVLRGNGFTAAFSTINGTIQCQSYIFALRRTNIGNAPLSSYGF